MWLAVTSLSFDISVLELLWTLARGFSVVVGSTRATARAATAGSRPIDVQPVLLRGGRGRTRRTSTAAARGRAFADAHGFSAVWTPERHFHAFGGLYPEPGGDRRRRGRRSPRTSRSARAASCCRCTTRAASPRSGRSSTTCRTAASACRSPRAGSRTTSCCARELRRRKTVLLRDRDRARCGGARPWLFPGRWATTSRSHPAAARPAGAARLDHRRAGNPETLPRGGRAGANILTHLLGQTVERWRRRSPLYREARSAAGHEGRARHADAPHLRRRRRRRSETVRGP